MQHCYACSEEALDQCKSCQQWFCARHGEGRCDRCRDLPGGYPSGLVYRGVLGTLVVALGLAGWHLWAWPQFPLPEPRILAALAAAETNVLDVTPVEPTPAPTVAATATATATAAPTAAATPAPLPTPTSTPTPTTLRYVVQPGDNLNTIAASFGVTVEVIIVANDIADPALIRVGAELIIPATAALAPTPTRTTRRYVVQDGDNLSTIAASFGVTADAISAANDITDPALIGVGEELIIPATATAAPQPAPTPITTTRRYVVQVGDNLSTIAASFGVTADAIIDANDITDPALIGVGEELIIPAATP